MPSARPFALLAAVALTLAAAGAPGAQEPSETQMRPPADPALALVHADRNFRGAGVAGAEARPNPALSWPVRSLRVERGGGVGAAWRLLETQGRNVFLADVLCTRQR